MEKRGGVAMIPTKRNWLIQLPVDPTIYALRNLVEPCFNKLKNARRLATQYDRTADSYLGFIHIASIRLWMRQFVNASESELTSKSEGAVCGSPLFCLLTATLAPTSHWHALPKTVALTFGLSPDLCCIAATSIVTISRNWIVELSTIYLCD